MGISIGQRVKLGDHPRLYWTLQGRSGVVAALDGSRFFVQFDDPAPIGVNQVDPQPFYRGDVACFSYMHGCWCDEEHLMGRWP